MCLIGMIVLIIGWSIMTLFVYWKSMLGIHPGLVCPWSKGEYVTRTTIKMRHFQNGTLNRRDTDHLIQEASRIAVESINQASHQSDIPEYSILEYFVNFRLFSRLEIRSSQSSGRYMKYSILEYFVNFLSVKCILWFITRCCCTKNDLIENGIWWSNLIHCWSSKYFKQNPIWAPSNNVYLFDHF